MAEPLRVDADPTPNPDAYKFTVNRELHAGRGKTFADSRQTSDSPLARQLLQIDGVRTLYCLNDFITVGRVSNAAWAPIVARVTETITAFFDAAAKPQNAHGP